MKLHASAPTSANVINAYGEGYVMVNGARHESSVIVTATAILDWQAEKFDTLEEGDFERLKDLGLEIVLLGTGPKQRFPHPRLTAGLARAGIGVEVMDLQAACRTYNILVAEERKVAAALLFE
ncbi:MAG TPA: Mth938-like domain-containing protein [Burkholderiales bacterium]|nr:Mth938-like domain-containing protein [Burkholderiales bacterium]